MFICIMFIFLEIIQLDIFSAMVHILLLSTHLYAMVYDVTCQIIGLVVT